MNITKKRLHKIKKTQNQSRKITLRPKKKTKKKKRSFRRKKRKYNIKNRSLKKYFGGAEGDKKTVYFLLPILASQNSLQQTWQTYHHGPGAYKNENPMFQLAEMTLTEDANGIFKQLMVNALNSPVYTPEGYRPPWPISTFTHSTPSFLHNKFNFELNNGPQYNPQYNPQNESNRLIHLFNSILIIYQINNPNLTKAQVKALILQILGDGGDIPYKTRDEVVQSLITLSAGNPLDSPSSEEMSSTDSVSSISTNASTDIPPPSSSDVLSSSGSEETTTALVDLMGPNEGGEPHDIILIETLNIGPINLDNQAYTQFLAQLAENDSPHQFSPFILEWINDANEIIDIENAPDFETYINTPNRPNIVYTTVKDRENQIQSLLDDLPDPAPVEGPVEVLERKDSGEIGLGTDSETVSDPDPAPVVGPVEVLERKDSGEIGLGTDSETVSDPASEEGSSTSETSGSSSGITDPTGGEEGAEPTTADVSYPYLIIHAEARPGPYQPNLDAHIHNRGGVDADEWIRYSMMGLPPARALTKPVVVPPDAEDGGVPPVGGRRRRKRKSRKKHRRKSRSKSFKKGRKLI